MRRWADVDDEFARTTFAGQLDLDGGEATEETVLETAKSYREDRPHAQPEVPDPTLPLY